MDATTLTAVIIAALPGGWAMIKSIYETRHADKKTSLNELSNKIDVLSDMVKAQNKAQKEIMQKDICIEAQRYIDNGEISLDDLGDFKELFSAYEALGKPCLKAVEAMEIIDDLPVKKRG